MHSVTISLWLYAKSIKSGQRVFDKFLAERELERSSINNLEYLIRENSGGQYVEVSFCISVEASSADELVINAIKVMRQWHVGSFSFNGSFESLKEMDVFIIADNIGGANGGIQNICMWIS